MPREDIRRHTIEQIREMNARGDYQPTRPDAPEFDGDEEFWAAAEKAATEKKAGSVQLSLDTTTVEYFKSTGPDHLDTMARVLNEHARKAS